VVKFPKLGCDCYVTYKIEKYFLAIDGILTFHTDQHVFELYPGDSLFFDGFAEHHISNKTEETIVYTRSE
jgi:mannose-6-phosphate isomerase-like protein (cupin superfamily)